MTDELIKTWKKHWTGQGAEAQLVRLRRRRWISHAQLAGDSAGFLAMAVSGAVFAVFAARWRDPLFVLAAAAMLLMGLPLALAQLRMRWRSLKWEDATPPDVLRSTIDRMRVSERILRLGRISAYGLLVLALIVWTLAALGLVHHPAGILSIITGCWIAAGVASLWLISWRLARTARRRVECEDLLRQFEEM